MRKVSWVIVVVGLVVASVGWAAEMSLGKLIPTAHADRTVAFKRVGETELRLRVFLPKGYEAGEQRPGLFVIHGGGWASAGAWRFAPLCRYFAGRGMVVFNAKYRLVSKETDVRIADSLADVRDGLRYVRESVGEFGVDPERIVVLGESAGGHLAAAAALIAPENLKNETMPEVAGLVLFNPCLDLEGLRWMKNHAGVAPTGETPEGESWQERARRLSPINFVREGLLPTLLIHGTEDRVVPVEQADRFAEKMKEAGNRIEYRRMAGWGHAFGVPGYGPDESVAQSMRITDRFLASLGYLEGEPRLGIEWEPPAYRERFTAEERRERHVVGRSFGLEEWPFLDGQWEGIASTEDGKVYFSVSSHDRMHHAQVFRYLPGQDEVEHLFDLGRAVGEYGMDIPTQDKIHSRMIVADEVIYAGTCEGHAKNDPPYRGGYWLAIDKETGEVENLGKSITEDGLITVGYDRANGLLYGHTNRKGLLTVFDPETRKERILGFPWKGSGAPWPRGLTLMIPPEGGRVYGFRRPHCSVWEYDAETGEIRTIEVEMPVPEDVKSGGKKVREQWRKSGGHITRWNEEDGCFYFVRSFDEALCRFYPPEDGRKGRIEYVHGLRPDIPRLYGNRHAACNLVIHDRTVYYTPYTGWGGVTHLVSYGLDSGEYRHHGPIVVEKGRRVNECHSMTAGPEGKLYLVAFVFSIEGEDPVRPNAMRGKYPFHPRLVILEPGEDYRLGAE